jgi:hypothetical protein
VYCYSPTAYADSSLVDKQGFTHDGYKLVFIDRLQTHPMPLNTDTGQGPIMLEFSYPQIVEPLTSKAKLFNKKAKSFAQTIWVSHGAPPTDKTSDDPDVDYWLEAGVLPVIGHDDETTQRFSTMLPGVISIAFSFTVYGHGGAHGATTPYSLNWLVGKGRMLSATDIFDPKKDWAMSLTNLVDSQYSRSAWNQKTGVERDTISPTRWVLTMNSLDIVYTANELKSCACGGDDVIVAIDWSDLSTVLNRRGLASTFVSP